MGVAQMQLLAGNQSRFLRIVSSIERDFTVNKYDGEDKSFLPAFRKALDEKFLKDGTVFALMQPNFKEVDRNILESQRNEYIWFADLGDRFSPVQDSQLVHN